MKLWRTFVRWLAKRDLAEAFEGGSQAGALMALATFPVREAIAFARGEAEGRDRAFAAVKAAARERGAKELTLEDVEKARKWSLH